ncbi:MAG TPA: hypothetical protein PK289_05790 [Bacteroidia bacterium]|nr:hypothetical protein [Bacteroidia bacterium]
METKQVIIQNKDEERQFLKEATERGWRWVFTDAEPIKFLPSESVLVDSFPYLIEIEGDEMSIVLIDELIEPNPLTVQQFIKFK